ncbi:9255_t:CDS:2, partial [Racocetra persica]
MNNVHEIFQVGICYYTYLFTGAHNQAGKKLLHRILSLDPDIQESNDNPNDPMW